MTDIDVPAHAQIVPMTAAHLDVVMSYEETMFGAEAWSRSAYLAELADAVGRAYFAVESDGTLVGWGGVRVIADEAEILTVGVLPQARRAGHGRLLVETLLAHATGHGAAEVFLEVRVDNAAAHELYRRAGFEEMGIRRGYYDGGRVDALTMRRDLSVATPLGEEAV